MNMKNIIIFVLCVALVPVVSATDWTFYSPTGLGFTDGGNGQDTFMIAENGAAGTGNASTFYLASTPSGTTGNDRLISATSVLYAMSDPTTPNRMFFTDEAGNIGYVDSYAAVNYSLGWYTETTILGITSCSNAGGNCNPMHRIGSLSAETYNRKIAIDSAGNVYTSTNENQIVKFFKSLGYSQQLFYTLVAGWIIRLVPPQP